MQKLLILIGCFLLPTIGLAQERPLPPLPPPPAGYCVFADRLYSPGAYLCVAPGTVGKCDATGRAWTAENSQTCQGANNPPAR